MDDFLDKSDVMDNPDVTEDMMDETMRITKDIDDELREKSRRKWRWKKSSI